MLDTVVNPLEGVYPSLLTSISHGSRAVHKMLELTLLVLEIIPFDITPSHKFCHLVHIIRTELSTCLLLPVVNVNLLIRERFYTVPQAFFEFIVHLERTLRATSRSILLGFRFSFTGRRNEHDIEYTVDGLN